MHWAFSFSFSLTLVVVSPFRLRLLQRGGGGRLRGAAGALLLGARALRRLHGDARGAGPERRAVLPGAGGRLPGPRPEALVLPADRVLGGQSAAAVLAGAPAAGVQHGARALPGEGQCQQQIIGQCFRADSVVVILSWVPRPPHLLYDAYRTYKISVILGNNKTSQNTCIDQQSGHDVRKKKN